MKEQSGESRRRGRPRGRLADGNLVRSWRRQRGLTLQDLARITGLSERTLRTVEHGGRASATTLKLVARHTGIPYASLIRSDHGTIDSRLVEYGLSPGVLDADSTSRGTLIESLCELFTGQGASIVCLSGRGGIGKTWAAKAVAQHLRERFADGIIWIHGEAMRTADKRNQVFERIAEALQFETQLPKRSVVGTETYQDRFNQLLWERPRLLIVDDLPGERLLRPFTTGGNHNILCTTRFRFVARALEPNNVIVPPLHHDHARHLLTHYLGEQRLEKDAGGTKELIDLLDGSPRALHIAGRILSRESYTSPGAFAARVRHSPELLLPARSPVEDAQPWHRDEHSEIVRHSRIELHLSPKARALHSALSVFGQRPFALDWAMVASPLEEIETGQYLAELVNLFLLDEIHGTSSEALRFRLNSDSILSARARGNDAAIHALQRLRVFAEQTLASAGDALHAAALIEENFGAWESLMIATSESKESRPRPSEILLCAPSTFIEARIAQVDKWIEESLDSADEFALSIREQVSLCEMAATRALLTHFETKDAARWAERAVTLVGKENSTTFREQCGRLELRCRIIGGDWRSAYNRVLATAEQIPSPVARLDAVCALAMSGELGRARREVQDLLLDLPRTDALFPIAELNSHVLDWAAGERSSKLEVRLLELARTMDKDPLLEALLLASAATVDETGESYGRSSLYRRCHELVEQAILETDPSVDRKFTQRLAHWALLRNGLIQGDVPPGPLCAFPAFGSLDSASFLTQSAFVLLPTKALDRPFARESLGLILTYSQQAHGPNSSVYTALQRIREQRDAARLIR